MVAPLALAHYRARLIKRLSEVSRVPECRVEERIAEILSMGDPIDNRPLRSPTDGHFGSRRQGRAHEPPRRARGEGVMPRLDPLLASVAAGTARDASARTAP